MVEALVSLIGLFVGLAASTLTGYLFKRLRQLEREAAERQKAELKERDTQIASLNAELSRLTARLAELEKQAGRVPALEQQVDTLCKELVDLRARLQAAEDAAKAAHDENGLLRSANDKLTKDNEAAQRRIHDLEIELSTYNQILDRIGVERKALSPVEEKETNHE